MKSTKKSFAISALSLIMCVAMLLGTTYAWFTDSVTSGRNKIIAGNLDIELVSAKKGTVSTTTVLFDGVSKWEPGAAAYDTLTVKNVGSLALKYQLNLIFDNETKVDGHGLSEVLKIGTYAGSITKETKRETVIDAVTDWAPLASFSKSGNLPANTDDAAVTYVIYWQPGDNDNLYNMNNGNKGKELSIDFGVELVATQDTVESDSFDKNYDIEAPWLGGVGELPEAKDGVIEIASAEQLAALSSAADSDVSGKTVKLVKDIDLNNIEWKPVTKGSISWTFDGNSHTILNLKVTSNQRGNGLFSWCPGLTVKNLTVDGAKISGTGMDGVIVGNGSCVKVDKCTVKNAEVISNPNIKDEKGDYNGDKSGIIVGYLCADGGPATVTNCVVEDSKITGYRQCGGIVGYVNGANASATGNKADKIEITIDDTNDYKGFETQAAHNVNGAIGQVSGGSESNNTAKNVTILTMEQDGLIKDAAGNYSITNAAGLVNFGALVNSGTSFVGKEIKIANDIDLAGVDWQPIHAWHDTLRDAVIDGCGHTISNMTVTKCQDINPDTTKNNYGIGFIADAAEKITIKNLTFDKANITDIRASKAAVVLGQAYGTAIIEKVNVTNSVVNANTKAAAILGCTGGDGHNDIQITNCKVDHFTINSDYSYALVVGMIHTNESVTLTGCEVTNSNANCVNAFDGYAETITEGNYTYGKESDGSKGFVVGVNNAWAEKRNTGTTESFLHDNGTL